MIRAETAWRRVYLLHGRWMDCHTGGNAVQSTDLQFYYPWGIGVYKRDTIAATSVDVASGCQCN